jgi:hypothetical protein
MTPFGWGLLVAGSVTWLGVVTAVVLARAWLDLVAERDAYRRLLGVTASERDEGDAVARAALDLLETAQEAPADLGVPEDYARPGQLLLLRLKRAAPVLGELAATRTRVRGLEGELAVVRGLLDEYRTAPTGEEFSPAEVLAQWRSYHAQAGPVVAGFHEMARIAQQMAGVAQRVKAQAPTYSTTP